MHKIKLFELYHNENEVDLEKRVNDWIKEENVNVVDVKFTVNLEVDNKTMDIMVIYKTQ